MLFLVLITLAAACSRHATTAPRHWVRPDDGLGACDRVTTFGVMIDCPTTNYSIDYIVARVPSGCAKNIRGNIAVAATEWLSELDARCDDVAEAERRATYGDVYARAEFAVAMCCELQHPVNVFAMMLYMFVIVSAACMILAEIVMIAGWTFA